MPLAIISEMFAVEYPLKKQPVVSPAVDCLPHDPSNRQPSA
jgi:hypothetical protein